MSTTLLLGTAGFYAGSTTVSTQDTVLRAQLVGGGTDVQPISAAATPTYVRVNLSGAPSSDTHAVPKSVTDALDARLDALEASDTVEALGVRMTAVEGAVVAAQSDADAAQTAADAAQSDVDALSAQYASNVNQDVRSTASVSFVNITASGSVNCGVLNATTINTTATTALTVADKTITVSDGAANKSAADGAGLIVDCGSDTDRTFLYNASDDAFVVSGAGGGIGIDKLRLVDDNYPAETSGAYWISATDSVNPVTGRHFIGPGTGSTWKVHFSTRTGSVTTDRVTIREDGRIGVGANTTSPGAILHLGSGSGADCGFLMRANNATTNGLQVYVASAGDAQFRLYNTSQPICFGATSSAGTTTESMRVHAPDTSNRTGVTIGSSAQNAGTLTVAGHSGRDRLVVRDESNSTVFSVNSSNVTTVVGDCAVQGTLDMSNSYRRIALNGGNSHGYVYSSYPGAGDAVTLAYNHYYNAAGSSVVQNSGGETSAVACRYGTVAIRAGAANTAPSTVVLVTRSRMGINNADTDPGAALDVRPAASSGADVLKLSSDAGTSLLTVSNAGQVLLRKGSNAGRVQATIGGASSEYGDFQINGYLRVWPASSDLATGNPLFLAPSDTASAVTIRNTGGLNVAAGPFAVTGDSTLTGALTVTGAATVGSLSTSGSLSAGAASVSSLTTTGDVTVGDELFLTPKTISTSSAAGTVGQIHVDSSYIYVCTGSGAWKRCALSSW